MSTIDYYNQHASEFLSGTINADISELHKEFLQHIPVGGAILDLGCGSGRDSKVFKDNGYRVTAIDGSEEMCKYASVLLEENVECRMFQDIEYKNQFDGVWACASLLHIPKAEMASVYKKIYRALKDNGWFYVSYKYGATERIKDGRAFSDYNEGDLSTLFPPTQGMTIQKWWITNDVRPERTEERWLNVIAKKIEVI